jgi:hypothetical protein
MRAKIFEAHDRPLFEEAMTCFEAGALRSSYIMTWISVAESLRNRLSVMAQRGDGQAGKILKELERFEKQNQATDFYLLDQTKDLGLVTDEQHDKLSHLRTMRNRYAHPTGRGPAKQETLAALEIVVDAVLSQPTLLRHGYADYQLVVLFDEPHWLPDDEQTVRENAASVARRLHPIAAPRLLEGLVEGYEKIFGDPERDVIRRQAGWFLGGFLAELQPDLSESRWRIVDVVLRRPVAASLMLGTPDAFDLLPDQARGMVLGQRVVTSVEEVTVTASENRRDAFREVRHALDRAAYAVRLEEEPEEDRRCRELLSVWDEERETDGCVGELERVVGPEGPKEGLGGILAPSAVATDI